MPTLQESFLALPGATTRGCSSLSWYVAVEEGLEGRGWLRYFPILEEEESEKLAVELRRGCGEGEREDSKVVGEAVGIWQGLGYLSLRGGARMLVVITLRALKRR